MGHHCWSNDCVSVQVCDVVDRVLKSPHADLLKEMNPVRVFLLIVICITICVVL